MSIADSISAAAQTPTDATARRLDLLHQSGNGWLDPQSQVALAQSSASDQGVVDQASAMRQTLNQQAATAGTSLIATVGHFFGDPVLQKTPSAALGLQQYLLQRQGWAPIAEDDLRHIQSQLADGGYLDKSQINGVWTPQSQQAFYQATSDHVDHQMKEGGGFSIGRTLGAFMPSHWIPAIVGAVKSVPSDATHLWADITGVAAETAHDVVHPTGLVPGTAENKAGVHQFDVQTSHDLTMFGNGPLEHLGTVTPDEVAAHRGRVLLNGVNALLTVAPVGRAGEVGLASFDAARAAAANQAIHDAAGTSMFRGLLTDLGPEAAQRGPGVISRSIYARGANDKTLGLLGSRLFQQAPILRQVSEPVKYLFDPEGKPLSAYYAMRTGLAQPMRLGGVQAAASTAGALGVAGATERGIAGAEGPLDKHNALRDQVYAQHLIGGDFGIALDILSGAFHGPIETPFTRAASAAGKPVLIGINPSQSVASAVEGVTQALDAAQKPLNTGWAFQFGTKLGSDGLTVEDLMAQHGSAFAQKILNDKINQFSAAHYAQGVIGNSLPAGSQEYNDAFKALSHNALHDASLLGPARAELTANMVGLANRFGRDAVNIHRESRDLYRQGISQFADVWAPMTELVANHSHELIAPSTLAAIKSAQEDYKFSQTMGDAVGAEPGAYNGYLAANHPGHDPGSIGLARRALAGQDPELETQTQRQFVDVAKGFQDRLDAAGKREFTAAEVAAGTAKPFDAKATESVKRDAIRWLYTFTGKDHTELDGLDPQQLIDVITEASNGAPRDVSLPLDPSPRASELWQQIQDAGYKVVAGTDIGHTFTPSVLDPVMIQGYKSLWRDVARITGTSTIPVSVQDAGTARRLVTERVLQEAINAGRIRVPPGMNAARAYQFMLNNLASRAELSFGEGVAFAVTKPLHVRAARIALGDNASKEDIADHLQKQRLLIAKGTQPLEVKPREIVKALMRPMPASARDALSEQDAAELQGLKNATAGKFRGKGLLEGVEDLPTIDEKSANLFADLIVRSAAHEPAWMFGAGKLEDLYRAGFGFLGSKASENVPLMRSLARAPNASVRFRNRYRFQLDPMFSMKRVAKSALKASIPGQHGIAAPLTARPFGYMHDAGTLNQDLATLERVLPMKGAEGFDTNDRLLYEQDAFGIYNPRHHMALRAGELQRAGLDDAEIRKDLTRTFTYGDRTALERTIGTVWYPFSFERTLWRNVGSYMLDRPGSRLIAGAALQAYQALGQHDGIDQWLKDHAPILKEAQKLNAFDHGIGPGQFGGINALYGPALWNVFGPQKYGAMKEPQLNAVFNLLPALRELNSLLVGESTYTGTHHGGTLTGQVGIGLWAAQHVIDKATTIAHLGHALDSPFKAIGKIIPVRNETWTAEQNQAWAYRNSLIMALAPVLDFNYHNRNAEKVWTADVPGGVAGKTINRSSIDEIVHSAYPSFDPSAAQSMAVTKQTQMERFLTDLNARDPGRAAAYQPFVDVAEKLRPILQRAIYDPKKYGALAQVTGTFREWATNLSEQDPQFLKFFNQFYVSEFGPIQAVTA